MRSGGKASLFLVLSLVLLLSVVWLWLLSVLLLLLLLLWLWLLSVVLLLLLLLLRCLLIILEAAAAQTTKSHYTVVKEGTAMNSNEQQQNES